jgi:hypothetical protein
MSGVGVVLLLFIFPYFVFISFFFLIESFLFPFLFFLSLCFIFMSFV